MSPKEEFERGLLTLDELIAVDPLLDDEWVAEQWKAIEANWAEHKAREEKTRVGRVEMRWTQHFDFELDEEWSFLQRA